MRKLFILFMIFSANLMQVSANAVEVEHLNQAVVPVTDRSAEARKTAMTEALKEVIIKNTGNPEVLLNPIIEQQLVNPDRMLRQFGYLQVDGQLMVTASFDQRALIRMLREANVAVWGQQRPLVLVWLASESTAEANAQRQLVSDGSSLTIRQDFKQQAEQRAMPLLFPVLDLDDMMQVGLTDVLGVFPEQVARASTRYQADFFVIASVLQDDSGWKYRLSLFGQDDSADSLPLLTDAGHVMSQTEAAQVMLTKISQYLVAQYAVADSGEGSVVNLQVSGITDLKQMQQLQQYLQQLSVVKQAQLARLTSNAVVFELGLFSGEQDLQRLLALESNLVPESPFKTLALVSQAAKTTKPSALPEGLNPDPSRDSQVQLAAKPQDALPSDVGDLVAPVPAAPRVTLYYLWQ
ncbi:DUF2066 domain-containing protein [Shewanella sp. NIFS-20-20]|uniref:DUF2066 domain-containing protein n=1 Tax=Shewanella sp. NIFS-20-20 TaxID=2853806 RepID=UPI001C4471D4|nr:DUF2066 domain-containing protein [Shewanella sp. NIFS-20-20]MBV7317519.1 DUF2066 domain-containing protein [Shewanella sp. NIFS-20-20]